MRERGKYLVPFMIKKGPAGCVTHGDRAGERSGLEI